MIYHPLTNYGYEIIIVFGLNSQVTIIEFLVWFWGAIG
jgi:hypothetical protein